MLTEDWTVLLIVKPSAEIVEIVVPAMRLPLKWRLRFVYPYRLEEGKSIQS
jgi:hypothetical protein